MADEKAIVQLRYDFLIAAFAELRTLVGPVVEHAQAALQGENDPALKKLLTIIHTTGQRLLDTFVYGDLEPDQLGIGVGYDLRSCSTVIAAYAGWLLLDPPSPLDEIQRRALIHIKQDAQAMLRFSARVSQALIIEECRTNIGRGRLAEVDLRKIVNESVLLIEERRLAEIETHGFGDLPKVRVDSFQVSEALHRIAAALSENFRRGKIVLTAGCDGDMVTIRLENTGFALPAAALEELERVSSAGTLFACRRFDVALDLCIGQAIIEIHGGKLWVGSRAEGGSQVTFTLPAMKR